MQAILTKLLSLHFSYDSWLAIWPKEDEAAVLFGELQGKRKFVQPLIPQGVQVICWCKSVGQGAVLSSE